MYLIPLTVSRPNLCLHGAYAVGEKMDDEKICGRESGAPVLGGSGAGSRYGRMGETKHYHQ